MASSHGTFFFSFLRSSSLLRLTPSTIPPVCFSQGSQTVPFRFVWNTPYQTSPPPVQLFFLCLNLHPCLPPAPKPVGSTNCHLQRMDSTEPPFPWQLLVFQPACEARQIDRETNNTRGGENKERNTTTTEEARRMAF